MFTCVSGLMGREILTIQVGGSGETLGKEFWKTARGEIFFNQGNIPRLIKCNISNGIVSSDSSEGCGTSSNCYAKAFHTIGPSVAHCAVNEVRRELEKCDSVQAIQFFHSIGGGTGSGLTGLVLKSVAELLGSRSVVLYSVCNTQTTTVLEALNATLSLQDLCEYCHMVFPFKNAALMAANLTGLTASLQFPGGSLNADMRKLHSSLVPFRRAHFLQAVTVRGKLSPLDLAHKALVGRDRYLATFLAYSGESISPSEVDSVTASLQQPDSALDPFFPDWIPNSVSASICGHGKVPSLTCVTNSTGISRFLDRITNAFDKQYLVKSYMHTFAEHGIHPEEMLEARNLVKSVSNSYLEYSKWNDKITGEMNIEQTKIANELKDLNDCFI